MSKLPLVYTDTETTGLDPRMHVILEAAFVKGDEQLVVWIRQNLRFASEGALFVNNYYSRVSEVDPNDIYNEEEAAIKIAEFTSGCELAGGNIQYDASMYRAMMHRVGIVPAWSYRLFEVCDYAAGYLGLGKGEPRSVNTIVKLLGFDLDAVKGRHTALGDALLIKAIHERVLELNESREKCILTAISTHLDKISASAPSERTFDTTQRPELATEITVAVMKELTHDQAED